MFITKKQLEKLIEDKIDKSINKLIDKIEGLEELIDKKIKEAFESWGFREEIKKVYNGFWNVSCTKRISPYQDIENKLNCLIKHLKLEYYKKEIKETNGEEKEYVKEGFRKIKVGKKKK